MQREIINPVIAGKCHFIKTSEETDGAYSHYELTLSRGTKNPRHKHNAYAETYTVLEGALALTVNDQELILKVGDSYTVEKGVSHRFLNKGKTKTKVAVLLTPGNTGAENKLRILFGLAADGMTDDEGVPYCRDTVALMADISDTQLVGIFSLFTPLTKRIAERARRSGLEQKLLTKYCENNWS
jgi:mannose-6-phosphate isomerase-like protein (cupin superfamily)